MTTQEKILEILEKNKGIAISGEEIATALNMSRAAIWKAINGLKENRCGIADNISMTILSMGMSADYYEAILEGANMVRIGSSLFGARDYT